MNIFNFSSFILQFNYNFEADTAPFTPLHLTDHLLVTLQIQIIKC